MKTKLLIAALALAFGGASYAQAATAPLGEVPAKVEKKVVKVEKKVKAKGTKVKHKVQKKVV